ncbi:MAG: tetratricopeptide repeat protein, partial [Desulfococcaceae bacterium]|nr:tetratricopeptide repeat protein [Desulfococcaceae bacterium]
MSEQENYANLLKNFNKAIELNSDNGILFLLRGDIYVKMEDYGNALKDYDKSVKLDSNNYI